MKNGYDSYTELSNCTFLKTILMLSVVLYHSVVFWTEKWLVVQSPVITSRVLCFFAEYLNSFHIYGFALVSGYIFYYVKYEKCGYRTFGAFFINKVKRLLVPYLFVAITWVIPISLIFFNFDQINYFRNYFFAVSPSQLWFLVMLFSLFVLFYIISDFVKKHVICGSIIMLFVYCAGIIGNMLFPNVFQIFRALTFMPIFWIGFFIRQKGSTYLRKIPLFVYVLLHLALFVLFVKVKSLDVLVFKLLSVGLNFGVNVIGALMSFVVLQKIADIVKWQKSKVLVFLGENSMPVYLFHQQIIYFTIYLFNGAINPYFHSAVNFIVSLVVSLVLSCILKKYKLTRFLIGERYL